MKPKGGASIEVNGESPRGGREGSEGMDVEDGDVARPCQDCLIEGGGWREQGGFGWMITEEVAKSIRMGNR